MEIFGQYGFALAIVTLFAVISENGLNTYQTRQIAFIRDKDVAAKLIADSLIARALVFILAVGTLIAISFAIDKPEPFRMFLRFSALAMGVNFFMGGFSSTLLGYERFKLYGVLAISTQFVLTALGFLALYSGFGLVGIGVGHLLAACLSTVAIAILVRERVCRFSLNGTFKQAKAFLKAAMPLSVTAVLMTVYYRADLVMLSLIKGDEAIGLYNSAYALVNGLLLVSTSFSATILPRLSGYFREDTEKMKSIYLVGFRYMLYFGLAAAFGATLLAEPIYDLIYPESYLPGIGALRILIWALALMFVNSLQSSFLIASDLKNKLMYITAAGAAINIVLNLILIPPYSFNGAAAATLISEILTGLCFYYILRESLSLRTIAIWLIRLIPAIASMAAILILASNYHVILRIAAGALIFLTVLTVAGGLGKRDLDYVLRLLPGGEK